MPVDVVRFGTQCRFLPEAIDALVAAEKILEAKGGETVFAACKERLFDSDHEPWQTLEELAEAVGIHPYTVNQLFLVYCADETKARYAAAGYTEQFYWDGMKDLKHKMEETHQVYGVWGVYCAVWLAGIMRLKIFCLGRMQFELIESEFSHEIAGHSLQKHQTVINMHIPSFGRLDYADVLDAYGRAAKFFADKLAGDAVWFHAETWILDPAVNALLPNGNLKRYSEDFDVVHTVIDPNTDDRYRIFFLPASVPVEEYPENNALQRNLKAWLLEGNTMGLGFGLFLWKDGKILHG